MIVDNEPFDKRRIDIKAKTLGKEETQSFLPNKEEIK
jgi:hypothetical protein